MNIEELKTANDNLALATLKYDIAISYNKHKDIKDQKEFALCIKDLSYAAILFTAKKTNKLATIVFDETPVEKQVKIFEKYFSIFCENNNIGVLNKYQQ